MLSQPRVQITLCRSFLYQAHPSAWASLLLGTHAGGLASGISKAGQRARARRSSPRCPSGGMPVHPAQRSPGSGWDPNASWACTSTNLALALATRGAEEQKTRRSLPSRKRQPMTPQKKTAFPSVSLQTNGRRGPGCCSNPEYPKGTIDTQDRRARCKQLPPTGRPSKVWFARWPSVSKWNSKSTDVSAAMFRFLYTVSCVSSYCFC